MGGSYIYCQVISCVFFLVNIFLSLKGKKKIFLNMESVRDTELT